MRFTNLFDGNANKMWTEAQLALRPVQISVPAEIAAEINALKGDAPELLNTLGEISNAGNDDENAYDSASWVRSNQR
jgi:hypothetical protein